MTQKQQLETLRTLRQREHDALLYLVLGRVRWTAPMNLTRIGGMPPRMMRVGIMESSDPHLIVHDIDSNEVVVATPNQAADWPWPTVNALGLDKWLREHASRTVSIHTPSYAWVREATRTA
jgi:hypothetical protein